MWSLKLVSNFQCLTPTYICRNDVHTDWRQLCSLAETNTHLQQKGNVFTLGYEGFDRLRQPRLHTETQAFTRRDKHARTRRQMCSQAETNAFTHRSIHYCSWRYMHVHTDVNKLTHKDEHVRTLKWNAFASRGKYICTQRWTRSHTEANAFELYFALDQCS